MGSTIFAIIAAALLAGCQIGNGGPSSLAQTTAALAACGALLSPFDPARAGDPEYHKSQSAALHHQMECDRQAFAAEARRDAATMAKMRALDAAVDFDPLRSERAPVQFAAPARIEIPITPTLQSGPDWSAVAPRMPERPEQRQGCPWPAGAPVKPPAGFAGC
jgi:hypothetical protein